MLNAILRGKGRRIPDGIEAGASLSHAIRPSEDLLTASVFERLGYLPGPLAWSILRETFPRAGLPAYKLAELEGLDFWPNWSLPKGSDGEFAEPD